MQTKAGYTIRDGKAFHLDREIPDADLASLEIIDDFAARDDLGLILCGARVKGVDAFTFAWIEASEQDLSLPDGHSSYFRTRDGVYYWDAVNKVSKLRTQHNPGAFHFIDKHYATDGEFVFFERRRLPAARVRDWHRLGHCFFASSGCVYSWGHKLRGASASTFEVLPGPHDYARDGDAYFVEWRNVGPKPFLEWLSGTQVVSGRVVSSVATRGVKWMTLRSDIATVDDGEDGWLRLLVTVEIETVYRAGDRGEPLVSGRRVPVLVNHWRGCAYPYRGPVRKYEGQLRTFFLRVCHDQPRDPKVLRATLYENEACLDLFNYVDHPRALESILGQIR